MGVQVTHFCVTLLDMEQDTKRIKKIREHVQQLIDEVRREKDARMRNIETFRLLTRETRSAGGIIAIAHVLQFLSPLDMMYVVGRPGSENRVFLEERNIWEKVADQLFGEVRKKKYSDEIRKLLPTVFRVDYFWLICCVWRASRAFFPDDEETRYNVIHSDEEIDYQIQDDEAIQAKYNRESSNNIMYQSVFRYVDPPHGAGSPDVTMVLEYHFDKSHLAPMEERKGNEGKYCRLGFDFRRLEGTRIKKLFLESPFKITTVAPMMYIQIRNVYDLVASFYIFMSTEGFEMTALKTDDRKRRQVIGTIKEAFYFYLGPS